MNNCVRILLADDHYVVRMGIKGIIETHPGFLVTGEVSDGSQALEAYNRIRPDVTLMDIRMPVLGGIEATARICRADAEARILMLTTYDGDEDIHRALEAGAKGYLLKTAQGEEMIAAIDSVRSGRKYLPAELAAKIEHRTFFADLSDRELDVLRLMAQGLNNLEIAKTLFVSHNTVKTHAKQIFAKLGAKDRGHAVCLGVEKGLVRVR